MNQPKYKFYATLLDAFQWYLTSESDNAFEDFINKLNRVPFSSEAAEKGTAFNNLVDRLLSGESFQMEKSLELSYTEAKGERFINYNGFQFKEAIVKHFVDAYEGASIPQVFTKAPLETNYGTVELYGYIDEVMRDSIEDIKTTKNYTFPKYLHNFQHLVYPYCMNEQGLDMNRFVYRVTDFNNIYLEEYLFNKERDTLRLKNHCERLIEFIELNRDIITDRKLFALEDEVQAA
jgi:hypothetical protein